MRLIHLLLIWQDVLLDLMSQTKELRAELSQKDESINYLDGDIKDITVLLFLFFYSQSLIMLLLFCSVPFLSHYHSALCILLHVYNNIFNIFQARYNAACQERENISEQNLQMQAEICELKETLDRNVASSKIEVIYCVYFCVYVALYKFNVMLFVCHI